MIEQKTNSFYLNMPITNKDSVKNLREWNVSIDNKNYLVQLQEVTNRTCGYPYTVLRLTINPESSEEFSKELNQRDNIFEFCDRKFLLRNDKTEHFYDLYMDGKLIY